MTRVQKYHSYREEIANMKSEDFSFKKITSDKVKSARGDSSNTILDYNEIVNVYDLPKNKKIRVGIHLTLDQFLYFFVGIAIIVCLLIIYLNL